MDLVWFFTGYIAGAFALALPLGISFWLRRRDARSRFVGFEHSNDPAEMGRHINDALSRQAKPETRILRY